MNEQANGSLYPSAKVEPELGYSQDVVATIEMTEIYELKPEPHTDFEYKAEPTIVTITSEPMPPIAMHLQEKVGSNCCGCCCDYRRAILITNVLFIFLGAFVIVARGGVDDLILQYYDDDAFVDEASTMINEFYMKRTIFLGIAMFTAFCAMQGAVYFNVWLVGAHAIWMVVDYVAFLVLAIRYNDDAKDVYDDVGEQPTSPVPIFIVNGFFVALVLYPHLGFISEFRAGIMTRETYPREQYSCCCHERRYR
jgi:hypothetical protein